MMSCAAPLFSAMQRVASVGTLMGTLPGLRFYHQGELEGRQIHQPIELGQIAEEPAESRNCGNFRRKFSTITNEDVFHKAQWNLLPINAEGDTSPDGLIAYEWRSSDAWKIDSRESFWRPVARAYPFGRTRVRGKAVVFYDELNDVRYARGGEELQPRSICAKGLDSRRTCSTLPRLKACLAR